jgi:hypothetical protein
MHRNSPTREDAVLSPVRTFVLGAIALILTGCARVIVPEPAGERPVALVPAEWSGLWLAGDAALRIEVLDAEKGALRLVWIEGGKTPKLETAEVLIRESGDNRFASMRVNEITNAVRYVFGRIKKEKRQMVAWMPDPAAMKSWVQAGKLPGKIEGHDVHLGALTSEHLGRIVAVTNGLLDWDDPLVFFRLTEGD